MILGGKNRIFRYATERKFYDIVCIGTAAEKTAKIIERLNKKLSLKKLFFKGEPYIYQPSLSIITNPIIPLSQQTLPNTDVQLRNQIMSLNPKSNTITLINGQQIKYNHLIFSGQQNQWKSTQTIPGMTQALATQYTSTFGDIQTSNPNNLYMMPDSDIYINLTQERHFGYENLFILSLVQSLKNLTKNQGFHDGKIPKVKVLANQKGIIPYNSSINNEITQLLQKAGVQIINNAKVQLINHKIRQFTLVNKDEQSPKAVNYCGFYHYLPFRTPLFLQKSQINPLAINKYTLLHQQYGNVHIIGNVLPTAYSFYQVNNMVHVVAKNIVNSLLRQNHKKAIYQGDTIIPFWTGEYRLRYFKMNYEKANSGSILDQNQYIQAILAYEKMLMARSQRDSFYNGKSYGFPYYLWRLKSKEIIQGEKSLSF